MKSWKILLVSGWVLLVGGVLLAMLALLQNDAGLPLRVRVKMPTGQIKEVKNEEGMTGYQFRLPGRLALPKRLAHLARVFEDDLALPKLGKSHGHAILRGEGRFFVSERAVTFTLEDGSDPRTNGRSYSVSVPYRFKTRQIMMILGSGVLGLLLLLGNASGRASLSKLADVVAGLPRRCEPWLARWFRPYLVVWLSLPSFLLFATLPPLWKDDDALIQILSPPSSMTILHFSWLYSLLARLPGYLLDWVLSLASMVPWPGWTFWRPLPDFELRHAYALLLVQHALLWLALAWVIRQVTRGRSGILQVVMVGGCLVWAPFYTFAHLMGTEAGAMLASFFTVGAALLVMERMTAQRLALYGFTLFAAAACRHIFALLAAALPLALLSRAIFARCEKERFWCRICRAMPGVVLVGLTAVMVFGANSLVKLAAGKVLGFENRSTFGRVAGTRETFLKCPQQVRDKWFQILSARLKSPHARHALEASFFHAQYWAGGRDHVASRIAEESGLDGEALELAIDRAFEESTKTILFAMSEPLLQEILSDTRRVFLTLNVRDFAYAPVSRHQKVERCLDEISPESIQAAYWGGFGGRPAIDYDHAEPLALYLGAYLGLLDGVTPAVMLGLASALAAFVFWRSARERVPPPNNLHLGIALLATATGMMLATNLIICFFDRYALPVFTLYPLVFLIMIPVVCSKALQRL